MGKAAKALLVDYPWPGNVRELRNLCEQLSILRAGYTIMPENLLSALRRPVEPEPVHTLFKLPEEGINLEEMERHLLVQALERTRHNKTRAARLLGISRDASTAAQETRGHKYLLQQLTMRLSPSPC